MRCWPSTSSPRPVVLPIAKTVGETASTTAKREVFISLSLRLPWPARVSSMGKPRTAEDILPLLADLDDREKAKLLRLITKSSADDARAYAATPPGDDEFSSDDKPLAWDAEGWENVG